MDFVGKLSLFAAVKKCYKSIKNLQSYSHGQVGTVFLTHGVYIEIRCVPHHRVMLLVFEAVFCSSTFRD